MCLQLSKNHNQLKNISFYLNATQLTERISSVGFRFAASTTRWINKTNTHAHVYAINVSTFTRERERESRMIHGKLHMTKTPFRLSFSLPYTNNTFIFNDFYRYISSAHFLFVCFYEYLTQSRNVSYKSYFIFGFQLFSMPCSISYLIFFLNKSNPFQNHDEVIVF